MTATSSRDTLLQTTEAAQSKASHPETSAWVSANAGAGKTHVLKLRVLRLLLAGTAPERILCLTYTKAAAAEMSQRVFAELADWAIAEDEALEKELAKLLGRAPTADQLTSARQLFARAIETPGGLKVQTIHAFCERLLHRFPLEASVPPGFTTLDDQTTATLRREAIDKTLTEANAAPQANLGRALLTAVARAADDRFDQILRDVLTKRDWLEGLAQAAAEAQVQAGAEANQDSGDRPQAALERYYRRIFDLPESITPDGIETQLAAILRDEQIELAAQVLATSGKNDQKLAENLRLAARSTTPPTRIAAFAEAFLTKAGEPRSDRSFVAKAVREGDGAIADMLCEARDNFHALQRQQLALETIEATLALIEIGNRVLTHYKAAKARRAALDFDDLIVNTSKLLATSQAADWILYKLDGGLDHILVDEAQDTSPLQWSVIEALAAEFYAGEGTSEAIRTVFAVGDEKQSIYSFQGAAPERFARAGARFSQMASAAGQAWAEVPLTLSFRTVEPVLAAVDTVFSDDQRTPGVNMSGDGVRHLALRIGEAGLVEIWPTITPEDVDPAPAFAPLADTTASPPSQQLADKIATRIADWIKQGEPLPSLGRPVRASDFLILVRRRQPFAPQMVRALKDRQIPVAGADRIILTEQIVVQDLIALADFIVLPEDDLALAAVLKSPLINLDDCDLLRIAPERKGSLWSALLATAKTDERFLPAVEALKRWRGLADFAPPYEFFAALLDRDGGRSRLIGRLGIDAADALDEFMNLALTYDEQAPASLQGFVSWLRDGRREIKRDMDHGREEVRVMTVHGAKGLEAPIVFLPDTCSSPGSSPSTALVDLAGAEVPGEQATPQAWAIKGARSLPAIAGGRIFAQMRDRQEYNRLLYVAMTRARDRLYVCGYESKKGRSDDCWYETIWSGLESVLAPVETADGETVWRLQSSQDVEPPPAEVKAGRAELGEALPEWALTRAPSMPQLTIPLAPSRLAPLETDEEGEPIAPEDARRRSPQPAEPAPNSPRISATDNRFLRGILTHALLEHLPGYDQESRRQIAESYLAHRADALHANVRADIVREVLAILDDPRFAPVFAPDSRAEVPIVAEIARPDGSGPPLRLNGQIDRLAQTRDKVLIVDYKTNRHPPPTADLVADVYLLQLSAYRLGLKEIFPDHEIEAAILWTDGATLMPVSGELLDIHQQRLWQLKTTDLDAA